MAGFLLAAAGADADPSNCFAALGTVSSAPPYLRKKKPKNHQWKHLAIMSCRPSFLRLRRQKKDRPRIDGTAKDSSPASNPNAPSKQPNPQLQSLFITRLPLDIRVLIYEFVLASAECLHIIDWLTNLGHVECKEEAELDNSDSDRRSGARSVTHNKCLGYETPERALSGPWPMIDEGKMGLLACCGIV